MTLLARHSTLLAVCLLAASGCNQSKASSGTGSEPSPAAAAPAAVAAATPDKPDPAAEASRIFRSKCSICHGAQGAGDGAGAAALTPKPRTFSDADWQAKTTDDRIKQVIVEGGAAVGLSAGMPSNLDLKGKDEVLAELVKVIRGFKR
jgi:mono/diheme cytochrome c family protein